MGTRCETGGGSYACGRCNDSMAAKLQDSHERICAWLSTLHAREVEQWLAGIGPEEAGRHGH